MKNALLFRFAAMLALGLVPNTKALQAQDISNSPTRSIVRVDGLTSAARDAIARDLNAQGHARLVFACVPAGILVFEPVGAASQQQLRNLTLPVVQRQAGSVALTELTVGIQEAEAECAQVRDR